MIGKILSWALSRALEHRYQINGDPPMVWLDTSHKITTADIAIVRAIRNELTRRDDSPIGGKPHGK